MLSLHRIAWPLVIVLAFSAVAAWHVATAQDAKPKTSQQWEYQTLVNDNIHGLNRVGLEGWELVAVTSEPNNMWFYLKRPK